MRAALLDPFTVPFMARALAELAVLAVMCGPVSLFILLRRMSFAADALTHTVFPGVVVGFLLGGLDGVFGGALVAGLLTALGITVLGAARQGLTEDATVAVLLTAMFSLGVLLISRLPSYTGDLTAFLFGRILTVSGTQLVQTMVVAAIVLGVLAVGARALLLRAFDPDGAAAAGVPTAAADLVLNALVALVVVAAVRAVGTVLVVALLIVPAAAARLVTDRLVPIVLLGSALTFVAGYVGLLVSWHASIDYGLRLTSASAIVLALVLAYLVLGAVPLLRKAAR
jgi:ABC-type Mn2+/Zn2+ transport system permease subunit